MIMMSGKRLLVALVLVSGLVAGPLHGHAAFVKHACFDGASWLGSIHPGESSAVTIIPCNEEEPASIFALSCRPGDPRLSISLDYSAPAGDGEQTYDVELKIDKRSYRYEGKLNQAGLYETMEFDIANTDPLIENLMSGQAATYRAGDASGKFHLKGTRALITALLRACGF